MGTTVTLVYLWRRIGFNWLALLVAREGDPQDIGTRENQLLHIGMKRPPQKDIEGMSPTMIRLEESNSGRGKA
jgi:hypothetical protein